jgi:uncharacterized surface protein with fasciclin (FAS1) repeats
MRATRADKVFDPMANGAPRDGAPATRRSAAAPARVRNPGPYRADQPPERTIVETAAATGTFETLGRAIRAAGLVDLLSGTGPFTLFAPTDEAFAKLPAGELAALLADAPRLERVVSSHVVRDTVEAPKVGAPRSATNVDGGELTIVVTDRGLKGRGFRVNDARIVKTEIRASNGVIHAIDTVLMPR